MNLCKKPLNLSSLSKNLIKTSENLTISQKCSLNSTEVKDQICMRKWNLKHHKTKESLQFSIRPWLDKPNTVELIKVKATRASFCITKCSDDTMATRGGIPWHLTTFLISSADRPFFTSEANNRVPSPKHNKKHQFSIKDTNKTSLSKIIIVMVFVKFIHAYTNILILICLKIYGKTTKIKLQFKNSHYQKKLFLTMKLHSLLKFTKIIQCNDSLLHVNCIMNLSLLL